jgi:hypothetical protein
VLIRINDNGVFVCWDLHTRIHQQNTEGNEKVKSLLKYAVTPAARLLGILFGFTQTIFAQVSQCTDGGCPDDRAGEEELAK